ncbi:putative mucin TcMUCII [Trypanosoma cruzi]|uniref:Putative mucin TcMUCII n=1 Tax=Trypanosoma cruzi TaxID=5693 RepID=A0A2V2XAJ5_TRYCR|nr:putative mucin TcMUCII [Trypanosoma cruzi]
MMTMCRLLCALLVLALCCCPSMCASDAPKVQASSQKTTTTKTQAPTVRIPVTQGPQGKESGGDKGNPVVHGDEEGTIGPVSQLNAKPNALAAEVENAMIETTSDKNPSAEQAVKKPDDPFEKTTTTTTTQAPTTTTTTTAPHAPSTTTTEAPTTTTTRAPSRLREVDGSLSSSAWVCAPLLLAVSVLAYTAVG